jgi:hypothetical protein
VSHPPCWASTCSPSGSCHRGARRAPQWRPTHCCWGHWRAPQQCSSHYWRGWSCADATPTNPVANFDSTLQILHFSVIFDVCELIFTNLITEISAKQHLSPSGLPALHFGCTLGLETFLMPLFSELGVPHPTHPGRGRTVGPPSGGGVAKQPRPSGLVCAHLPRNSPFSFTYPFLALKFRI